MDGRLNNVEWEVIGGETTMMPFEFWEEMLPYTLERIERINQFTQKKGALNFLTNLIYKDKRYTELFNKYGDHELFCLYTSWEPDTNRFGNNDKLLPKFKEVLGSITAKEKILDIILTKTVVEMDPEDIIKEFGALGITDYSIKQLSPYGSGKEFFKHNMVSFDAMADFLLRFEKASEKLGGSFTPMEEMLGAHSHGTAFQCNGNFKYDLSIEPDGLTHFNANQTMGDMVTGFKSIYVGDEDWAERVIFENTQEEANKLTLKHPECGQCEYLRYCNAGWYHYKLLDPKEYERFAQKECAGFKAVWDSAKAQGFHYDVTQETHMRSLSQIAKQMTQSHQRFCKESEELDYQSYIQNSSNSDRVEMVAGVKFGKTVLERCFYYEALGISYKLPQFNLIAPDFDLINHLYSGVLDNAEYDPQVAWSLVVSNSHNIDMSYLLGAYNAMATLFGAPLFGGAREVVVDKRNDEVFRAVLLNHLSKELLNFNTASRLLEDEYLQTLLSRVAIEAITAGKLNY